MTTGTTLARPNSRSQTQANNRRFVISNFLIYLHPLSYSTNVRMWICSTDMMFLFFLPQSVGYQIGTSLNERFVIPQLTGPSRMYRRQTKRVSTIIIFSNWDQSLKYNDDKKSACSATLLVHKREVKTNESTFYYSHSLGCPFNLFGGKVSFKI